MTAIVHDELLPEAGMDREDMLAVQDRVRSIATFVDDHRIPRPLTPETIVGGLDLAFDGDDAVAAAVAMQDGSVIERAHVRLPVALPYIPGLLAFREAQPMVDAIATLDVDPDIFLCDGNGRIHFREAGLATHVGTILDTPTIGVAKRLLCGELSPGRSQPYDTGVRVPIVPDDAVEGDVDEPLGYAVQTRQWDRPGQSINPVYVSPGHRIGAETAADIVLECTAGYKLPEPIRQADQLAGSIAHEG